MVGVNRNCVSAVKITLGKEVQKVQAVLKIKNKSKNAIKFLILQNYITNSNMQL